MSARHHDSKKHDNGKPAAACHLCKEKYVYPEHPTPSGICHKCQTKIGVVILACELKDKDIMGQLYQVRV